MRASEVIRILLRSEVYRRIRVLQPPESPMETLNVQTEIGTDGRVRIDVPCHLPPGPAEVVVLIRPSRPFAPPVRWRDFYGLGKEIWGKEDAQAYVDRLRDE